MRALVLVLIVWAAGAKALTFEPYGGAFVGGMEYTFAPPFNIGSPGSYKDKLAAVNVGARLTQNISWLFLGVDYNRVINGKNTVDKSVTGSADSKFSMEGLFAVAGFGLAHGFQFYLGHAPDFKFHDDGSSSDLSLLGSATKIGFSFPVWFMHLNLEYQTYDFKKLKSAGVTSPISNFFSTFESESFALNVGIPISFGL